MIDCIVIGAGPAGLMTSAALAGRGIEHAVLERGRVGQSWRCQRWHAFRLNTPGWASGLFGAAGAEEYFGAPDVVERLVALAAAAEVREGIGVSRLAPDAGGFTLDTTDGQLRCKTVVVATGDENVPRLPWLAQGVPGRIASIHTADYRAPEQLPQGRVLVVGSGQRAARSPTSCSVPAARSCSPPARWAACLPATAARTRMRCWSRPDFSTSHPATCRTRR